MHLAGVWDLQFAERCLITYYSDCSSSISLCPMKRSESESVETYSFSVHLAGVWNCYDDDYARVESFSLAARQTSGVKNNSENVENKQSGVTMLGFAMVQYFAICRPLQHLYVLRRRKIFVFLILTWVASLVGGFAPLSVLALIVRAEDCAAWLLRLIATVVRHGVNVDAAFLALVHTIIVV